MRINSSTSNSDIQVFIIKAVFFILPVVILLITVNFFLDGAHIFSNTYIEKINSILQKNKYATNLYNYDERLCKKTMICSPFFSQDITILGSSRTLVFHKELFSQSVFFNCSVSGASVYDYIAFFQLMKDHNRLPKSFIICIDPWSFNGNTGETRWKTISEEYYKFFGKNNKTAVNHSIFLQLISPSYFQYSVSECFFGIINNTFSYFPAESDNKFNQTNTLLPDGSMTYAQKYRESSDTEIDKRAYEYIHSNPILFDSFSEISEKLTQDLFSLITEIRKNNISVSFILLPCHPEVFRHIKNHCTPALETESMIRKYSSEKNIHVYGTFNPEKMSMDSSFFYDGIHCTEAAAEKALSFTLQSE